METSPTSQCYEDLLQQIVQLNADLHKTATLSQNLQRERDDLQQNNRTLKEETQRLHERCSKLQQVLMQETEHKIQSDRKHQELIAKWKQQLEAKAKAFAALQKRFAPPKDLEQLRITIQEELEEPHRQRLEAVQNELEKHRQLAFRYRHEFELLKTEHDQFTINQGNEMEAFQAAHEVKVKDLQKKLEGSEQIIRTLKSSSRGRDSLYEKDNYESQIKQLREEIQVPQPLVYPQHDCVAHKMEDAKKLRAERTVIVERAAAASMASEKRIADQTTRSTSLELENKALHRQVSKHKEEMNVLSSRTAQAESKLKELQEQVEKLREQLRQKDALLLETHNGFSARLQEHRYEWDQEQISLRGQLENLKQRLGEQQSQEEVASMNGASKRTSDSTVYDISCALQTKNEELDRLRAQVSALEKQLDAKEQEQLQHQHQHETEVTGLREQLDSIQRQYEFLEQEKAQWMAKHNTSAEIVARVKADAVSIRSKLKEVENEYHTLQNKHRELMQCQEELHLDNQQKEAKLSYLEQDIDALNEKLQRDKEDHEIHSLKLQHKVKAMELSFQQQQVSLKKELRSAVTKALRELEKTQKKRDAYKKKCLEAHEHLKGLAAELEKKSATLMQLKHDHSMETQQLLSKLNEIETEKSLMLQQQFAHHEAVFRQGDAMSRGKAMEITELRPTEPAK